jgi:hypothetical protein
VGNFQYYIFMTRFSKTVNTTSSSFEELTSRVPDDDRFGRSFLGDWCLQVMVF